jgi:hypothetical protein
VETTTAMSSVLSGLELVDLVDLLYCVLPFIPVAFRNREFAHGTFRNKKRKNQCSKHRSWVQDVSAFSHIDFLGSVLTDVISTLVGYESGKKRSSRQGYLFRLTVVRTIDIYVSIDRKHRTGECITLQKKRALTCQR